MLSRAVVLRTGKYADDRLIVETYTEVCGPQDFIVRISHGGRTQGVRHTLFYPLALVELDWDEHQRVSLRKPRSARPVLLPTTLQTDPVKNALVLFLAEFLRAVLRHEPATPRIYNYVEYALRWLDAVGAQVPVANFHLAFLVRMTHMLGIAPSDEEVMQICPVKFRPYASRLLRINMANQHLYQFTRAERAEFLRIILLYYRTHQTAFPELKSVEVLTELFD